MTLYAREWECSNCKTKHDKDVNAAINIKKFLFQYQNPDQNLNQNHIFI
nr:zinc ribbon domain-containing protein [Methanosarcina barkeri]